MCIRDRLVPAQIALFTLNLVCGALVGSEFPLANKIFLKFTEEVSEAIDAALLFLKKSRKYVVWDDEVGTTLLCYSLDLGSVPLASAL